MATQKSRTKNAETGPVLPEFSDAVGIEELWRFGYRVTDAWFFFASEYERGQFRDAQDERRSAALQKLMEMELCSNVASGALVCLGIPIPAPKDGMPVRIPATIFESGTVDWDKEELTSLGVRYGAIRVLRASIQMPENGAERHRAKIGRPSVDAEIDDAIARLNREDAFSGKSRKQMVTQVQERARTLYPGKFGPNGPSRTKVMQRFSKSALTGSPLNSPASS